MWGTANLFSNPRYVHGAATSPNADAFAYAAAQVKKAIEVTKELGGAGYTFWGGREGYQNLWNTDMKRELDHLARFMHMAVDYAKQIGFTGQFYFEPKPKEPTKHQYDFDAADCINFLRTYGLTDHIKLNLETNHATLAGHTMQHELEYAGSQGFLGSIDANTGDLLLGWDTDQFPTDIYLTTTCMLSILKYGGLAPGGINFDAKVRRESFEPVDLFHAHIGGMDAFARGLKIAAAIRADGVLDKFVKERYASWDSGRRRRDRKRQGRLRLARALHARKGGSDAKHQRPPGDAGEFDQHVHLVAESVALASAVCQCRRDAAVRSLNRAVRSKPRGALWQSRFTLSRGAGEQNQLASQRGQTSLASAICSASNGPFPCAAICSASIAERTRTLRAAGSMRFSPGTTSSLKMSTITFSGSFHWRSPASSILWLPCSRRSTFASFAPIRFCVKT